MPRPRTAERIEEILELLRCPVTGHRLSVESAECLVTGDGSRRWPLKDGRPVFFGKPDEVRVFPDAHLSNALPPEAMSLIEEAAGPVLNLSAGGTRCWLPNVVELETAIFRNTDIVGDSHALPFADGVFHEVLALNAFEHYRQPHRVAAEILRVLKPGGRVFIHTAFLQPLHEAPWHFFNCTKFGMQEWFSAFEITSLSVSENFNPIYALSWQASELLGVLQSERGATAAGRLGAMCLKDIATFWAQPGSRRAHAWQDCFLLSQPAQERLAAGFQLIARKAAQKITADPSADKGST